MGTHSAVAVKRNGKIKSWERTFDGYILVDTFYEWVNGLVKTGKEPFEWTPNVDIGSGSLEIDDEREHDQSYFVGIDYDDKIIYTNFVAVDTSNKNISKFVEQMCELYKRGWKIRYGRDDDCFEQKTSKGIVLYIAKDEIECKVPLLDKDFDNKQKLKKLLIGVRKILTDPTVRLIHQSGQDPSLIIDKMINELKQKLK
jgi:hypothetical protein